MVVFFLNPVTLTSWGTVDGSDLFLSHDLQGLVYTSQRVVVLGFLNHKPLKRRENSPWNHETSFGELIGSLKTMKAKKTLQMYYLLWPFFWKIWVKLDHLPRDQGKTKRCFKPPPSYSCFETSPHNWVINLNNQGETTTECHPPFLMLVALVSNSPSHDTRARLAMPSAATVLRSAESGTDSWVGGCYF